MGSKFRVIDRWPINESLTVPKFNISARSNKIFQKRTVFVLTESWSRDQLMQKAWLLLLTFKIANQKPLYYCKYRNSLSRILTKTNLPLTTFLHVSVNRVKFNEDDGDGDDNDKKAIWLMIKRLWSLFFCTFRCRHCTTTTWNFFMRRFLEDVKPAHDDKFFSLLLNLSLVSKNSIPGKFTHK